MVTTAVDASGGGEGEVSVSVLIRTLRDGVRTYACGDCRQLLAVVGLDEEESVADTIRAHECWRRCEAMVRPGLWAAHRCKRQGRILRDGRWVCGTHQFANRVEYLDRSAERVLANGGRES